jgi:hypothetical protein
MNANLRRRLLAILGSALIATPVRGANLLPNPGFATDLSGWILSGGMWSMLDSGGALDSGSAEIQNTNAGVSNGIRTCVPVQPGLSYDYGAKQFTASGQPSNGYAEIALRWYADPSCTQYIYLVNPTLTSSALDAWTEFSGSAVSPANAEGAILSLYNTKPDGAPLQLFTVNIDDAFLPEPDPGALQLSAVLALVALRRRSAHASTRARSWRFR